MFPYIVILGLLLLHGQLTKAAAFVTPSATASISEMSRIETVSSSPSQLGNSVNYLISSPMSSLPPLSRITQPPSANQLELRQRCWNDQGFPIDCTIWTGYHYSWGPASNPYDYWSGSGGSAGGLVSSDAPKVSIVRSSLAIVIAIVVGAGLVGGPLMF